MNSAWCCLRGIDLCQMNLGTAKTFHTPLLHALKLQITERRSTGVASVDETHASGRHAAGWVSANARVNVLASDCTARETVSPFPRWSVLDTCSSHAPTQVF
ncbi:hypothetical protein VTI74DRAFT_250 [Chaetomium olivicolor]